MNRWLGYGWKLVALSGALCVFVGALHTDLGKPLLALLPGGCPASLEAADPDRTEAFRVERMRLGAGVAHARETPAWHFTLGATRQAEVEAWASKRGVRCEKARQGSVLRCSDDPCADPAMRVEDAHLQFDAEGLLVAVDIVRQRASAAAARQHVAELGDALARRVGPTTNQVGQLGDEALARDRFSRVELEYRYRSYLAKLSATNLGTGSVLVREQYQWWPKS